MPALTTSVHGCILHACAVHGAHLACGIADCCSHVYKQERLDLLKRPECHCARKLVPTAGRGTLFEEELSVWNAPVKHLPHLRRRSRYDAAAWRHVLEVRWHASKDAFGAHVRLQQGVLVFLHARQASEHDQEEGKGSKPARTPESSPSQFAPILDSLSPIRSSPLYAEQEGEPASSGQTFSPSHHGPA